MATNIIALDVGAARVGVAIASTVARLPNPLMTLGNTPQIFDDLAKLCTDQDVGTVVVGLPRNLSGEATSQTAIVEAFVGTLQQKVALPIVWQDEALTSVKAEEELRRRGKPYAKNDIDALAATYILEDYLRTKEQAHAGL